MSGKETPNPPLVTYYGQSMYVKARHNTHGFHPLGMGIPVFYGLCRASMEFVSNALEYAGLCVPLL